LIRGRKRYQNESVRESVRENHEKWSFRKMANKKKREEQRGS